MPALRTETSELEVGILKFDRTDVNGGIEHFERAIGAYEQTARQRSRRRRARPAVWRLDEVERSAT